MVTETALSVKGPKLFPWEQPETCLDPNDTTLGVNNKQKETPVSRNQIRLTQSVLQRGQPVTLALRGAVGLRCIGDQLP